MTSFNPNTIRTVGQFVQAIHKNYEDLKGRNNHEKVWDTACGGCVTNCYVHGNEWCDGGNRYGNCGTRKDHSRIYLCPACHKNR